MFVAGSSAGTSGSHETHRPVAALDCAIVLYLALPLALFLAGWYRPGLAVVLELALIAALWPLVGRLATAAGGSAAGGAGTAVESGPAANARPSAGFGAASTAGPRALARPEIVLALAVALGWTLCGGTGHWVFANADWQVRDAVLHDLVAGRWPVGYGMLDGTPTILRAPLGFYLPAALIGKLAGLRWAHVAMSAWTALGVALFLLAVISLVPARRGAAAAALAVVVLFSGLDLLGTLMVRPEALAHLGQHLEWWARDYQYSSMTTQLFWVPNHALGGWLAIVLLARTRDTSALEPLWALIVIAVAFWSPLAALGLAPFVLWRVGSRALAAHSAAPLMPRNWAPALLVGLALASYLALDAARIPKGLTFGRHGLEPLALAHDFMRQGVFFLLEAGLVGCALLMLVRSSELVLALALLALLPLVSFGAANDLAMRASIPSLAVLALGAALALVRPPPRTGEFRAPSLSARSLRARKAVLGVLLLLGAVTPLEEFARAVLLPRWPINLEARLIEAACGAYPAHYVARLKSQLATYVLRTPQVLAAGPPATDCHNPAARLMREHGL